jgi:hypothetical protein
MAGRCCVVLGAAAPWWARSGQHCEAAAALPCFGAEGGRRGRVGQVGQKAKQANGAAGPSGPELKRNSF